MNTRKTKTSYPQIDVRLIVRNPEQPRKYFNPDELQELADSIKEHGVIQPLALDPSHWMYFDIRNVRDAALKKSLKAKAREWGDEWWKTPRVARQLRVGVGDVNRYIQAGRIQATQIHYSLGGRHPNGRWANWFVLRSEATRSDLKFVRRKKAQ